MGRVSPVAHSVALFSHRHRAQGLLTPLPALDPQLSERVQTERAENPETGLYGGQFPEGGRGPYMLLDTVTSLSFLCPLFCILDSLPQAENPHVCGGGTRSLGRLDPEVFLEPHLFTPFAHLSFAELRSLDNPCPASQSSAPPPGHSVGWG